MTQKQIREALEILGCLCAAPVNRFGKPEFLTEEAFKARERLRLLAVKYNVTEADTVLHQAARVAAVVLNG